MTKLPNRPLTRKAVKAFFDKVSEATWDYYFDVEKANGLADCRVPCDGRIARYDAEKVKEWLLAEGHYRPYDLQPRTLDSLLNLPIRRHAMAG